jgi:MFS transporter, PPP family, 3-phenylpropionic acid transporter
MSPAARGEGTRLSTLHAATFLGVGIYLPFFPVWLASKALSPATISIILSITIIVRILATAPLLALADRRLGPRRLLLASHAVQALGYPLLATLDLELSIAAAVALLAMAHAAVIPANDLVTMLAVRTGSRLHYGRIRAAGSVAFLLTSILAGILVDRLGAGIVPWCLAATPILAFAATAWAVPPAASSLGSAETAVRTRSSFPKTLWLVIGAAALIQASHAGIYTFGSIYWRTLGFPDRIIGILWASGVVAEIATFAWLGKTVGRGSGFSLLMAGGLAGAVRFLGMSLEPALPGTFLFQILHGLSFAATHLGAMAALAALAPDDGRGRAQGMLGSVSALAFAAATLASGPLYETLGPNLFAAMAPISLAGFVLAFLASRQCEAELPAQPQSSGAGGDTTLPS